jgi:hypothetical protein
MFDRCGPGVFGGTGDQGDTAQGGRVGVRAAGVGGGWAREWFARRKEVTEGTNGGNGVDRARGEERRRGEEERRGGEERPWRGMRDSEVEG